MKKKSIGLNAALNSLKTVCSVIFPLITFPYVSRILHVNNIGVYSFCYSIISYFTMLAGLGIVTYSIREGARYRDDKEKLSTFASEIFSINIISMLLSYLALILCIFFIPDFRENYRIIIVLSMSILFTTIGCEWIFNIFENFIFITIRNVFFQFVSLILLFLFVRNENDLIKYAAITVISSAGANIINAFSRRKYCKITFMFRKSMVKHIVPILVLFVNSIAMTIYINSDVTMLGLLAGDYYTGLYSISTKVYTMIKSFIGSIIVVSIPRLSSYLGKGNSLNFQKTADKLLNVLLVILIPAITGLFMMSRNIILILAGMEYSEATLSLEILSIALIFSIFSWFYASCILIPNLQEKKVLIATTTAALANLFFNIVLIPIWMQNAAALTTCIAELISAMISFIYSRTYYRTNISVQNIVSVLIGSLGIVLVCEIVLHTVTSVIMATIISIIGSVLVYGALLLLMKNRYVDALVTPVLGKFKKKVIVET